MPNTYTLKIGTGESPSGVTPDIEEDFSTYTSTANFLTDPRDIYRTAEDINTDDLVIDTSVGYAGSSQSMRYNFPAGTATDYTISRSIDLPASTTEIYIRVVCRFSTDFTLNGNGQGSGPAYKWLFVTVPAPVTGRFDIGLNGSDSTGNIPAAAPNDTSGMGIFPNPTGDGTVHPEALFDEQWHDLRYHVRLGDTDFHEYSLDGTYYGSNTGSTAATALVFCPLGRNLNMLSDHAQEVWWGLVQVYYSNSPGWTGFE